VDLASGEVVGLGDVVLGGDDILDHPGERHRQPSHGGRHPHRQDLLYGGERPLGQVHHRQDHENREEHAGGPGQQRAKLLLVIAIDELTEEGEHGNTGRIKP